MSSIEPFDPKLQFLTVDEVASALRVSSMTIYRLIKEDAIESVRCGRSIRISTANYFSYIGRLEAEAKDRVAQ